MSSLLGLLSFVGVRARTSLMLVDGLTCPLPRARGLHQVEELKGSKLEDCNAQCESRTRFGGGRLACSLRWERVDHASSHFIKITKSRLRNVTLSLGTEQDVWSIEKFNVNAEPADKLSTTIVLAVYTRLGEL